MDAPGTGGGFPMFEAIIGLGGAAVGFLAKLLLFTRREGELSGAAAARQTAMAEKLAQLRADFDRLQSELHGGPNRGDIDRLRADIERLDGDLRTVATKTDIGRLEQMLSAFVSRFDDRIDNLIKARA